MRKLVLLSDLFSTKTHVNVKRGVSDNFVCAIVCWSDESLDLVGLSNAGTFFLFFNTKGIKWIYFISNAPSSS